MLIRMLQEYGFVLDGMGIALCVAMIGYLIRNRVRTGRLVPQPAQVPDFGDQMLQSMVTQHTRRVLMAAMAKVGQELQSLGRGDQMDLLAGDLLPQRVEAPRPKAASFPGVQRSAGLSQNMRQDHLAAVFGLLETGTAVADISRSVQRPVAEIELCAWLARHRTGGRKEPETS